MRQILLLIFVTLSSFCSCKDIFKDCFVAHRNIQLECVKPIERRTGITEGECGELCGQLTPQCRSAQYDAYRNQCDLFDEPSPLDMPISAKDITKYRRRLVRSVPTFTGQHIKMKKRELGKESKCYPMVVPSIGVTHYSVNITCLRAFGIPLTPTLQAKSRDQTEKNKIQSNPVNTREKYKDLKEEEIAKLEDQKPDLTLISTDSHVPFAGTIEVLPLIPDCPNDEVPHVQIINGVQIDAQSTLGFVVDSPEACIHVCRTSSYLDGTRLPLLCRSAHFDLTTKRCSFYPDALNPNGYLNYIPNNQMLYMEKICISPVVLSPNCDEASQRIPQHILVGHASDILTAASQQECILHCLTAYRERGFTCRSIIHYSDFPASNCILNFHTKTTRPQFFAIELLLKVDYVEVPKCSFKTPIFLHEGRASLRLHDSEMIRNLHKSLSPMDVQEVEGGINKNQVQLLNAYVLPSEFDKKKSLVELNTKPNPSSIPFNNLLEDKNQNLFDITKRDSWSPWSECDLQTGMRKRSKICDGIECKAELEIEPCFSEKEFDQALSLYLKEEKKETQQSMTKIKPQADERADFFDSPTLPKYLSKKFFYRF
ncbi:unnamed protein product, partial [Mesorhabditis belari]|uniref:Apple domain-containing protein n=1 Tax=Mesorhabditis belari TaxID=2138241 RepID=A0AAF3FI47_9BILA